MSVMTQHLDGLRMSRNFKRNFCWQYDHSTSFLFFFVIWLSHQEVLILWAIWNCSSKSCWSRHERARYSSIHPGHSTNISQMFSVHKAKKSSTWTFILIECTTPIDLLFAWTGGVVLFGAILVLVDRLSLIFFFVRAARSNMKKQTSSDHSALWDRKSVV